eukprot:128336-Amorphochlora_amoeboformis.AAC.1
MWRSLEIAGGRWRSRRLLGDLPSKNVTSRHVTLTTSGGHHESTYDHMYVAEFLDRVNQNPNGQQ